MPARAALTCALLAFLLALASGCGQNGGVGGNGGLTGDEQAALDSAVGAYLGQIDSAGKKAAGTAYGACHQAATDYPIVHRQLFARAFAKRAQVANGKGKRRVDLRSICLVAVSFASS